MIWERGEDSGVTPPRPPKRPPKPDVVKISRGSRVFELLAIMRTGWLVDTVPRSSSEGRLGGKNSGTYPLYWRSGFDFLSWNEVVHLESSRERLEARGATCVKLCSA